MPPVSRLKVIERQIADLRSQLERLSVFGDDDFEDNAVLMFDKKGYLRGSYARPAVLTYVAIKKNGSWWVSNGANRPYSWDQLVEMMAESEQVWQATEWGAI